MNSTTSWVVSLCIGAAFAIGCFVWLASIPLLSVLVGLFWGLLIRLTSCSYASKWKTTSDFTKKSSVLGGAFTALAMFTSFSIGMSIDIMRDVGLLTGILVLGAMSTSFYIGVVLESMKSDEMSGSGLTSSESTIQTD